MSLEIGDKAPDFTLPTDSDGKVSLKGLKGKTVILLALGEKKGNRLWIEGHEVKT